MGNCECIFAWRSTRVASASETVQLLTMRLTTTLSLSSFSFVTSVLFRSAWFTSRSSLASLLDALDTVESLDSLLARYVFSMCLSMSPELLFTSSDVTGIFLVTVFSAKPFISSRRRLSKQQHRLGLCFGHRFHGSSSYGSSTGRRCLKSVYLTDGSHQQENPRYRVQAIISKHLLRWQRWKSNIDADGMVNCQIWDEWRVQLSFALRRKACLNRDCRLLI